jgi:hypothetical protein
MSSGESAQDRRQGHPGKRPSAAFPTRGGEAIAEPTPLAHTVPGPLAGGAVAAPCRPPRKATGPVPCARGSSPTHPRPAPIPRPFPQCLLAHTPPGYSVHLAARSCSPRSAAARIGEVPNDAAGHSQGFSYLQLSSSPSPVRLWFRTPSGRLRWRPPAARWTVVRPATERPHPHHPGPTDR